MTLLRQRPGRRAAKIDQCGEGEEVVARTLSYFQWLVVGTLVLTQGCCNCRKCEGRHPGRSLVDEEGEGRLASY